MLAPSPAKTRFRLVLIKPSHYDDDGYVIQWYRSPIPANSLACLYGLATDCAERHALGPDVSLEIVAIDETNQRIRPEKLAREIRGAGGGMVMLVGVQSNQFPRALDLTAAFRKLGVTVGIGGFHVSGTLAMLPEIEPGVQKALDLGAFVFAGEAEEGRLEEVLVDATAGRLKPIYNFMADLPGIEHVPDAACPGRGRPPHLRRECELRRRPRLSLPVLLLHHHQRAGAEVAAPLGGRRGADRAHKPEARNPAFLHHR